MARTRSIKPGFFKNEILAELPLQDSLLFIGLWMLADREGRLEDRPRKIRAEIFPYSNETDVEASLARLANAGFILRYGPGYIHICSFHKHQSPHYKELPSIIPAPPDAPDRYTNSPVTEVMRRAVFERDGLKCLKCSSHHDLSVDHIIPRSSGGNSAMENLQTLCKRCNSAKNNKLYDTPMVGRPSSNDRSTMDNPAALVSGLSGLPSTLPPETPEPEMTPSLDEQFQEYKRLFETVGNTIPEDFANGSFCWRSWTILDYNQRVMAIEGLKERVAAGVTVLHSAASYLQKLEYKRPIRKASNGKRGMTVDELAAL